MESWSRLPHVSGPVPSSLQPGLPLPGPVGPWAVGGDGAACIALSALVFVICPQLFCSMSATFTLNFFRSGIQFGSWGSFQLPGLLNFGEFKVCFPFSP